MMTDYVQDLGSYTPDELLAGGEPVTLETVITGAAALTRGAVLGKVETGTVVFAVAGGNTGDGTFAATPTVGAGAKSGTYTLTIFEAAANAGQFEVRDPDGDVAGIGNVGAAFAGVLNFTLQDGATDFAVGDQIFIDVNAGSGNYQLSASAATDGSQIPRAILAEDVDASAADKPGAIYVAGQFNEHKLNFGAGHSADSVRDDLATSNIYLKKAR